MMFLDFFFSGFACGAFLGLTIWLIRLGVRYIKGFFDSPAWVDD